MKCKKSTTKSANHAAKFYLLLQSQNSWIQGSKIQARESKYQIKLHDDRRDYMKLNEVR